MRMKAYNVVCQNKISEFDAVVTKKMVWEIWKAPMDCLFVKSLDLRVKFFYWPAKKEMVRIGSYENFTKRQILENLSLEEAEDIILSDEIVKEQGLVPQKSDIKLLEEIIVCG